MKQPRDPGSMRVGLWSTLLVLLCAALGVGGLMWVAARGERGQAAAETPADAGAPAARPLPPCPCPDDFPIKERTLDPDAGAWSGPSEQAGTKPIDAPKPPLPPADCLRTGWLDLEVRPPADVYFGEEKLGRTPLRGVPLPEGIVTLTLRVEGQGGYWPIGVEIRYCETTREVVDRRAGIGR
jgi:hypothetical protein